MADWFKRGASKDDIEKARKEASGSDAYRFYLKAEESKRIIFLDDEPFCLWEHNPVINDEFWHFFTCRKGIDENDPTCPLCTSRVRRQYTGYLTVLDATGYKNKKGDKVLFSRKLFPMTLKSLEKFNLLKKKKTSLVGAQYELTRTSKDVVRIGDHWDFEKIVDPFEDKKFWFESKLQNKKMPPEPFNYEELMEPLSAKEMLTLGIGGGDGDSSRGRKDDDDGSVSEGGDDDELY